LEAYREEGASDLETIANYFWNTELSEALYPSLQAFEIALRNSVHAALSAHFSDLYWFDRPHLLLDWQVEAVAGARLELTRYKKPHEPGRIVAELHFGFWHSMFNRPYEEILWYANGAVLLEAVFPNLPRSLRTRKEVWKRIDRIRRLRNRVFHYEPIWKKRDLEDLDVVIHDMLGAISPSLEAVVALSGHYRETLRNGSKTTRDKLVRIMELE
jgi:hypothetical protein